MRLVVAIQAAVLLLGTVILLLINAKQNSISFCYGSGLILTYLILMWWTFKQILSKKLIALAVMVIVFKYAIFAFAIYLALSSPDISSIWFSVGLGTLLPTVLMYGVGVKCRSISRP